MKKLLTISVGPRLTSRASTKSSGTLRGSSSRPSGDALSSRVEGLAEAAKGKLEKAELTLGAAAQ